MLADCDTDGNQHVLIDKIVDHKSDDSAVLDADQFVLVKGRKYVRKTTKGWKLCVKWKDNSTSWETLADSIQVAEYAVAQSINGEPAFAWQIFYTLRKRNWIIAVVNK